MPYDPAGSLAVGQNPFAGSGASDLARIMQQARLQLASQPQRLAPQDDGRSIPGDVNAALPEAYADPNVGVGAGIKNMVESLVSLPKRAIDASAGGMHLYADGSTPNQVVAQHTPGPSAFAPPMSNFAAATKDLNLNPQEQALYQRHLSNMFGPGGVDHADGSRSSLFQTTLENNGKFHNVPTVWDGKIEANFDPAGKFQGLNDRALANIHTAGINSFPAYGSEAEAEARYQKMHDYMDRDAADYFKGRR